MRVLVTGATGFVGSHILEALNKNTSLELVVACRDPKKLLPGFSGEIRQGDLRDSKYVCEAVKNIDVICHAAAWTSLWGHKQQSHDEFFAPTSQLIQAAVQAGVKQFIFPSTTSAAAPDYSSDPSSLGIPRDFWPHLCNVIAVENELRKQASEDFTVVVLRLGVFVGSRYGIGILPTLLPRLKTHLVPWVAKGSTRLPLIDGQDIGQAFVKTIQAEGLNPFESFNVVGPEQPSVKQLLEFIHVKYKYPKPHFSVSFQVAYSFAKGMEVLAQLTHKEPLVTRSLIHLMEDTHVDNELAHKKLGYYPLVYWEDSVALQMDELKTSKRKLKLRADSYELI